MFTPRYNVAAFREPDDMWPRITGSKYGRPFPDRLLDEAAEIRLADIRRKKTPAAVSRRGKSISEQAAAADEEVFSAGKPDCPAGAVAARAASRVDDQMRAYMETRSIAGPWERSRTAAGLRQRQPLQRAADPFDRRLCDEG